MTQEPNALERGVLCFFLLVTPRPSALDFPVVQKGVDILNVMPVKFYMHILNCVSKTGKWAVAQNVIRSVVSYCLEKFGGLNVFTESDVDNLREKVMGLGCAPDGLPPSVGGTWKYEDFTKWCRLRNNEELYFEERHLPKTKVATASTKPSSTHVVSDENKKQRTKSLNVIHSRQKRERRKSEQIKMQHDCSRLQAERWVLQQENARLEGLLVQARKLVEQLESNNRLHSQFPSHFTQFEPQSRTPALMLPQQQILVPPQGSQLTEGNQISNIYMNALAMQHQPQQMNHCGMMGASMNPMGVSTGQPINPGAASPTLSSMGGMIAQPIFNQQTRPMSSSSGISSALLHPQGMGIQATLQPLPLAQPPGADLLNFDPLAPLDIHRTTDSSLHNISAPAPIYQNEQNMTLRNSVPREFAGLDIPEPDPLPEL
jgi:hypothetical protein